MKTFLRRHPLIHAITGLQIFFFILVCNRAGMGPVAVFTAWFAYGGIEAIKNILERSAVIEAITACGEYFPDLSASTSEKDGKPE